MMDVSFLSVICMRGKRFEDTRLIRSHKLKGEHLQWPKEKGQKDKQWSTTHHIQNFEQHEPHKNWQ